MKDFDEIFGIIGEFGRYQKFHTILVTISSTLINAYAVFGLVFLIYTPKYICDRRPFFNNDGSTETLLNSSGVYPGTSEEFATNFSKNSTHNNDFDEIVSLFGWDPGRDECDCPTQRWAFAKDYFDATVATEFNLICSRAIQPKIVIEVLYAITAVGCVALAIFQDKVGRKPTLTLILALFIAGNAFVRLSPNIWIFTGIAALNAFIKQSAFNHGYIWNVEFVGPRKRTVISVAYFAFHGISVTSLALLAYVFNDWRTLSIVISVPFVMAVSFNLILYESPRWLIQAGRGKQAAEVVRKMQTWESGCQREMVTALLNSHLEFFTSGKSQCPKTTEVKQHFHAANCKVPIEDNRHEIKLLDNCENNFEHISENFIIPTVKLQNTDIASNSEPDFGQHLHCGLFRYPNIRYKTLLICTCHLITNTIYTGFAFNIENLGGNPFLTFAGQAIMETPAVGCNLFLLERYGRIPPLVFALLATGLTSVLCAPAAKMQAATAVAILSIAGKFAICCGNMIVEQMETELFPTSYRATGKGFGCMAAAIGNMVMPFIIHSARAYRMAPMLILGGLAIFAATLACQLPETKGALLPETIEEAEKQGIAGYSTAVALVKRAFSGFSKEPGFKFKPEEVNNSKGKLKKPGLMVDLRKIMKHNV